MTYFQQLYARPVMAEPFKSEWRKEFERRSAEEAIKFVPVIRKVPTIAVVRKRAAKTPRVIGFDRNAYMREERARWRVEGRCGACGREAIPGRCRCVPCNAYDKSNRVVKTAKKHAAKIAAGMICKDCGKVLNKGNRFGYCGAHYRHLRRQILKAA